MKGYQMIFLVNGFLFLFAALATMAYGGAMRAQAAACVPPPPGEVGPDCDQMQQAADAVKRATPWLLVVSIVLFAAAFASSVLARKSPPGP